MSREALAKVVQRAIGDAAFRRQLSKDPTGALRGFNLTADEAAAIRSGDPGRLSALGVDQRMSKAFTLGAVGSKMSDTDLVGGNMSVISSGSDAGSTTADLDGGGAASNALVTGDGVSDSNALIDPGFVSRTVLPSDPAQVTIDDAGASGAANVSGTDAWVVDEGHEPSVGYAGTVNADVSSHTFSGDDIAGPAGGLGSADTTPDETGDGNQIVP